MTDVNLKDNLLDTLTKYYDNLLNTDTEFSTTIKEINNALFDKALEGKNRIKFSFQLTYADKDSNLINISKYSVILPYIKDLESFNKVKTYYSKVKNMNVATSQKTTYSFIQSKELILEW